MAAFGQSPLTLTQALLTEAKVQQIRDSTIKATEALSNNPHLGEATLSKSSQKNNRHKTLIIQWDP